MGYHTSGLRALSGLLALALLAVAVPPRAHAEGERPAVTAPPVALLQVTLRTSAERARFLGSGFDVIAERPGSWARILGWPGDAEALRAASFEFLTLDADYGRTLALANGVAPKPAPQRTTGVPPFGSGSLGGFYTLAEIDAFIDSLASHDPNGIVSSVVQIGTSRQGRPIRAIRIASEAFPDHSRPRVLFTGITHAREPGGMQNILYFVDKLLQGYGTDPNLTYLVDQREMWFVPCTNPDGYKIDENTWFGTGSFGFWRKNARDNDGNGIINGADGVDLNRNFGYKWGYDNTGSSPTPSSDTYRGPSAFSEPETQALRDFCILHGFRTGQNFHTYHEATLYPFGYNGSDCPDAAYYIRLVDDLVRDAHYTYGKSNQILYPVNGDANDWMYGEQTAKPKVIAMTTEAGGQDDGFWPAPARIVPIAHQNFRANMGLAYAAGTYVRTVGAEIVSSDGWLHPYGNAEVALTLRNDGLEATTGTVTVTATTDAPGITVTDGTSTFPALASGASATPSGSDRFGLRAASSVPAGTIVPLCLEIHDQGNYVLRDTTTITVGQPLAVFADDASGGLVNWTSSGAWGIQTVSGNPMFSDSPAGNYAASTDETLTLDTPLVLTGGARAFLTFTTKWDIEIGYDFGRVEASTDGGVTWTALAGKLTRPGHGTTGGYGGGTQPSGVPGYDGAKRFLAPEVVDLLAYAGQSNLLLRFRLTSDSGFEADGWLVDDIRVLVYPEDRTDVAADGQRGPAIELSNASANPFSESTRLLAGFRAPTPFRAAVYAVDGRCVRVLAAGIAAQGSQELVWDGRDRSGDRVASGAYLVKLESGAGTLTRRVVLLR